MTQGVSGFFTILALAFFSVAGGYWLADRLRPGGSPWVRKWPVLVIPSLAVLTYIGLGFVFVFRNVPVETTVLAGLGSLGIGCLLGLTAVIAERVLARF
jgi:hypothetical protein